MENSTFTSNIANKEGGAVYLETGGNVTNCSFTNNEASAGTSVYTEGRSTIEKSTFTDAEGSNVIYGEENISLKDNTINNSNYVEASSISSKTVITLSILPVI